MNTSDDLIFAASPMTPDGEAKFRESVRRLAMAEMESGVSALHWTNTAVEILLATLDAERAARPERDAAILEQLDALGIRFGARKDEENR